MNLNGIPQGLKDYPYWCLWRYEQREGAAKPAKVPYQLNGERARSNDKATFAPFPDIERAFRQGGYDGIGIGIFDDIVAIDIDNCINQSPLNNEARRRARDICDRINSYTEKSPSGNGIRIIFYAPGFTHDKERFYINNQKAGVEVYVAGQTQKFVTITGDEIGKPIGDLPTEDKGPALMGVMELYMCRPKTAPPAPRQDATPAAATIMADEEIIAKIAESKQGETFIRLMEGDISGYPSNSEADLALCNILAFWCGRDIRRMDGIFRQSGLMRPKWDKVHDGRRTYGEMTLQKAVDGCKEVYDPHRHARRAMAAFEAAAGALEMVDPRSNPERYPPTELGNGYLFADTFKRILRFCPQDKAWQWYDGVCWRGGGNDLAAEQAKNLAYYLWGMAPTMSSPIKNTNKGDNQNEL